MSGSSFRTPIAVVGMSCRLPGADGLDAFWDLLTEGRSAVVELPPERLNRELYFDTRRGQRGKTYSTLGGLVPERKPQSGDDSYDVCHRVFADVALEACRNSGMTQAELAARSVGVFVGHSGGSPDFGEITLATLAAQAFEPLRDIPEVGEMGKDRMDALIADAARRLRTDKPLRSADGKPRSESRWAAELVARTLGVTGPNLVLDAACSSSLVALALGSLALERGEVDVALVGGASYAQGNSLILFSQAQSCSATGSRPFDDQADGLVGSEGYVAMVLKTEARARSDGDTILAVIRGIGLSTDGRGRHLWAPRKEGQTAAMKRAYGSTIDPGGIQYVEAHATSTQVGDATEIESMADFFGGHLDGAKVPIGSVKSNIGHTLETAGLASLLKVILAMRHQTIPPTINIEKLNGAIDWDSVPFEVTRSARPWVRPEGDVLRGAVSAFGIGGLNVHLIVEEPRAASAEERQERAAPPSREPIAIVGRGVVVPGAHDVAALGDFLARGVPALSEAPESRWPGRVGVDNEGGAGPWTAPTCRGGFVRDYEYDSLVHRVPPKQIAAANPLQFMLLDATEQALREAGSVDREHTGVVVGTTFGGEFGNQLLLGLRYPEIVACLDEALTEEGVDDEGRRAVEDAYEERFFELYPAVNDVTGSFTSSTLASRLTKAFDLEGGAMAIDAGDTSSFVALSTACALLRGNVCSAVVCAGAQRALDLPSFETMARTGNLSLPDDLPGEGVGAVVLKRLSDARRDGNAILGLLFGDGCRYDANDVAAATAGAATRALDAAGMQPDQVIGIAPGGGKAGLCEDQASGLAVVYGSPRRREPRLSSMMGHLGPAEGIVSLIRSTLDPAVGLEGHHTASDSGLSSHVLLGPPPPARTGSGAGFRVSLGASTQARLREKLVYAGLDPDIPFTDEDRFRLAVVTSDPGEMPARLALAESLFGSEDARSLLEERGVFLGEVGALRPRVAFVFSGQGSQYPGMLQDLVEHSPAARRAMVEADRYLTQAGLGTFGELAWGDSPRLDEDPVTTQVAVLVADTIMYAAVTESGLEPDCVCGHSFGEISAMVAARVLTLEQAIRVTIERARALSEANPDGGLLSVQASPDEVRELIAAHPGTLFVTHHNAPSQTVVGGRLTDLGAFAESLAGHGFKSRPLRVPGALHSPLVKAAQGPFRAALEQETLRPPTRLFYSNVSCAQVARPADFIENLVAQLVETLDYPALLRRLMDDGVGVLVEVGPGQVLTRLHRKTVGWDVVCTGTDHPRRSAWEQLERARAALECVGAAPARAASAMGLHAVPARITEFDATAPRREKRRAEAAALQSERLIPGDLALLEGAEGAAGTGLEAGAESALARLLLDFVVDLTGYPREAISLDWDLEADLGLDSIKRTQLVGEVAEALALETVVEDGATLAGLSTLRELLDYFRGAATPGSISANGSAANGSAGGPPADASRPERQAYEAGFEHGRRHASAIRGLLREETLAAADLSAVRSMAEAKARLGERDLSELQGMADGGGVHVGNLVAYRLRRGVNPAQEAAEAAPAGESRRASASPGSRRYVMGMTDLPHREQLVARRLHGSALVVGDNPVARLLSERLREDGLTVHPLVPGDSAQALAEEVERLWEQGPIAHLFLSMGHDPQAVRKLDGEDWAERRERVLMTPFSVCQRWLSLVKRDDLMDEASLVGLTELGGDLGFSSHLSSFESGALPGLLKAISIESWVAGHRHLPVKIVDASCKESPDTIVDAALRELAIPSYEAEIGIHDGVRRVVRPVQQDLAAPEGPVDLGRTWICTGGARGITAFVARELGRRFGLTLHLIGRARRAELPEAWRAMWPDRRRELKVKVMDGAREAGRNPVKAWESAQKSLEIEETLADLEQLGVEATYHSCDISDRPALERVLAAVRERGPIDGILHGAGSSRDAKFEQKEADRVDQCFRAKVDGTLALMEATRGDPIKHFVAFGSVSGRFGANGHADYSAANDMMAKLVDWYRGRRPEVAAVTFHWHAWGDVGMATKAETQLGLQLVDMDFMPAAEGVDHLIRELHAGAPEAEVLITQERYYARFYSEDAGAPAASPGVLRPLLGGSPVDERGDTRVFSCTLDPERDVFLTEHRLDGRPLMPLVAGLELAAEAALDDVPGPFVVHSVEVSNGLRFQDDRTQTVRIRTSGSGAGPMHCEVVSDFCARDGTLLESDRPFVRATFAKMDPALDWPLHLNGNTPRGPWRKLTYNDAGSRFHHGPAFQSLRRFRLTDDGLWGAVIAPAVVEVGGTGRPAVGWRIHLSVLDACFYATACLSWSLRPGHSIPAGVDQLVVGRFPLPREDCLVHVVAGEQTDTSGRFDFRLYGADGEALLDARGYRIARIAAMAPTASGKRVAR